MAWVGVAFKQLFWNIFRLLFCGVRAISWLFQGIYCRKSKNRREDAYEGTVQCLKVLGRFKMDLVLQPSGPDNFLLMHNSWKDPDFILDDTVTLYYVTATEAVFVQCPPEVNPASSNYSPFLRIAQFRHATQVLVMPINVFHKLAEEVGEPKGRILFVSNVARCGSTLLCQIFEESKKSIALSEPDSINALTTLRGLPTEQYDQMVQNIVRLLCKPTQRMPDCELWVLKMTQPTMTFVPYLSKTFPGCKNIFIYRNGMPVAKSLDRAGYRMPLLDMLFFFGRKSVAMTQKMVEQMGLPPDNYKVKVQSRLAFSTIVWASSIMMYRDIRAQGVEFVGVRYEDLISDPTYAVSRIFEYVGLSQDLVEQAVKEGMSKDSQRESPLSRDKLSQHTNEEYTEEIAAHCDATCDKFNLPKLEEACILEGTITNKDLEEQGERKLEEVAVIDVVDETEEEKEEQKEEES